MNIRALTYLHILTQRCDWHATGYDGCFMSISAWWLIALVETISVQLMQEVFLISRKEQGLKVDYSNELPVESYRFLFVINCVFLQSSDEQPVDTVGLLTTLRWFKGCAPHITLAALTLDIICQNWMYCITRYSC